MKTHPNPVLFLKSIPIPHAGTAFAEKLTFGGEAR